MRDVDDEVAAVLRARAARNGRSAEAEHRLILRDALAPTRREVEASSEAAARLRARLRQDGDSAEIVRAARDERGA